MNVLVLKIMIFEKSCMEDSLELDIDWDFAGLVKFGQKICFQIFEEILKKVIKGTQKS